MGDVSILMHTLDVFDDSIRFYVMMIVIIIAQWHTASIERCLSLSMSLMICFYFFYVFYIPEKLKAFRYFIIKYFLPTQIPIELLEKYL